MNASEEPLKGVIIHFASLSSVIDYLASSLWGPRWSRAPHPARWRWGRRKQTVHFMASRKESEQRIQKQDLPSKAISTGKWASFFCRTHLLIHPVRAHERLNSLMKWRPSRSTTKRRQAFRISAVGNIVTPSYNMGCISYFHCCCDKIWTRQLIQARDFEAYDSRGKKSSSWQGGVVASSRQGGRSGSLRARISKRKQKAERAEWKLGKVILTQSPPPVLYFL